VSGSQPLFDRPCRNAALGALCQQAWPFSAEGTLISAFSGQALIVKKVIKWHSETRVSANKRGKPSQARQPTYLAHWIGKIDAPAKMQGCCSGD